MATTKIDDKTDKLRKKLADLKQTLEANIRALEEAQAITHLGSWQWEVSTGEISWSDELYRIYGLKPQEKSLNYSDFMKLIHPDDREKVDTAVTKSFKIGKPFEFEHKIILPNKKIRVLHGKGRVVKDQKGSVLRMFGTSQDVTELKRANRALQLSDQRFKAVTDATSDIVYDIDIKNRTFWANEALTTSCGYPKSQIGKTHKWWINRIHPDDRNKINTALEKFLRSKSATWVAEYRFKKHDGTYIDIRDRSYVLRDTKKLPIRMIGTILDITQQKDLERAKDQFISLVSHQLRTPLTSMRLHAEMLIGGYKGKLNKDQLEYVEKIEGSTVRMINLVGDILNVSQIEHGRLKVVPEPTDLPSLIKWHVDELQPLAKEKDLEIIYNNKNNIPAVSVDPILFSQILDNLLSNAIRYTQKPKSAINVDFKATDKGYLLSVKDQGVGIPKSVQPHIFSSFFRAENAVKIHSDGTGLGLYLVKIILRSTGGETWFESTQDKGTTFYVLLPHSGMKVTDGDKPLIKDV